MPITSAIARELAVELYRRMVLLRVLDEKVLLFHRHGRIGNFPISWGQEAIHVGAASALRETDWVFPSYRDVPMGMARGMPVRILLAQARGHPKGFWNAYEWRMAPAAVPVASHISHAAGFAWGERLQSRDTVALVAFGDGATSEGDFHEAVNFAAVRRMPVVLLCSNNGWAISTPLANQTRTERLADKAVGYGIPGEQIDGYDLEAVFDAVSRAADRARSGDGPTLLECVTYRAVGHSASDEPPTYRTEEENARGKSRDCVSEYAAKLIAAGVLAEEQVAQFRSDAARVILEDMAIVEGYAPTELELLFRNTFAELPARHQADLEEVRVLEARRQAKAAARKK